MNGSRSQAHSYSDRTSLDELNRTIEALEARIEGLLGSSTRPQKQQRREPAFETQPVVDRLPFLKSESAHTAAPRFDPIAEIRKRQNELEAKQAAMREQEQAAAREQEKTRHYERENLRQQFMSKQDAEQAMGDIAQALVSLRQELKRDLAEGVAQEVSALRNEMRAIGTTIQDRRFVDDIRVDMGRLAESIHDVAERSEFPQAAALELRSELEGLRHVVDGLAREDSVRHMESRWDQVEDYVRSIDTTSLQEEVGSLAYRIEEIKYALNNFEGNPAIQGLETKLVSIAKAMSHLGSLMQPHDRAMIEHFSALDSRLEEISNAIAFNTRTINDAPFMQRLEDRFNALEHQIEHLSQEAISQFVPTDNLSKRIESLSLRMEELAKAEATAKFDERFDYLAQLIEESQKAHLEIDLPQTLADLSRKIDGLDRSALDGVLVERFDHLTHRLDDMATQSAQTFDLFETNAYQLIEERFGDINAKLDESVKAPANAEALKNLESQIANLSVLLVDSQTGNQAMAADFERRMSEISAKLDESAKAPADTEALKELEAQIANLSSLMLHAQRGNEEAAVDFERRMGAIETYMSTSDEYIIEAARHAAEAVVGSYAQNNLSSNNSDAEMAALSGLASDLRNLEVLSRTNDQKTHETFHALQKTLTHIAGRLDVMDRASRNTLAPAASVPSKSSESNLKTMDDFLLDADALLSGLTEPQISFKEPVTPMRVPEAAPAAPLINPANNVSALALEAADAGRADNEKNGGLMSLLGKRFRSEKKEPDALSVDFASPSLPLSKADSELSFTSVSERVEPSSGAPDVTKILERVRASQSAARASSDRENDRTDYIAAARRAAQAAALEMKPEPKKNFLGIGAYEEGEGGAFGRYRRPVLLAVGAVLLAILAFPASRFLSDGQASMQQTADVKPKPQTLDSKAKNSNSTTASATAAKPAQIAATTGSTPATGAPGAVLPFSPMDPTASSAAIAMAAINNASAKPASAKPQAQSDLASVEAHVVKTSTLKPPETKSALSIPKGLQPELAEAAKKGDTLALFEIGARYKDGRNGVKQDAALAFAFFKEAADKGFAPAQYRVAGQYEEADGVGRDLEKARQQYELAAQAGNVSAMHNLAVMNASGALGEPDNTAAAKWFTQAAEHGMIDSQFNLALLYARGSGVKQDLAESYKWFSIAAKGGDQDAKAKRDQIAKSMKTKQVEMARADIKKWKPQTMDSRANEASLPDAWSGDGIKTASVGMKDATQKIQTLLTAKGFDAGPANGEMNRKTVDAIKAFQKSVGQEPTGRIDDPLVKALMAKKAQKAPVLNFDGL